MAQYVEQPYSNPYVGSIADLITRPAEARAAAIRASADARARAAQQSGAAWGGAVQNIAQAAAAIPVQMQAQKEGQQRQQMNALQIQDAQRKEANAKIVDTTKQGIAALMNDPSVLNEDGTFNLKSIADKLTTQPAGNVGPMKPIDVQTLHDVVNPINQNILDAKESGLKYQQQKQNAIAGLAAGALRLGKMDGNYFGHASSAIASAQKSGLMSDQEATQTLMHLVENKDAIPQVLEDFVSKSTLPPIKLGKDEQLRNPLDPTQVEASNVIPPPPTRASLAVAAHPNDPAGALASMNAPVRPPNSQEAEFRLDGKDVKGDYIPGQNGQPGKYFYQGQDVTGKATKIPAAAAQVPPNALDDVKESVAGMKDGTLPPMMPGRATKEYLATMAEAHRQGYDLQAAVTDWNATQKHVSTMNGQQQLRLNQSINALPDLLDSVDTLASQWKAGKFPVLNKASLALAKNGAYGDGAATIARQLDSQIADVTADLGSVYMGGNSPTDHALDLASKSLKGEWSEQVLHDMVSLARKNVQIRQNSIKNTGVAGATADNPYAPKPESTNATSTRSAAAALLHQNGKASDETAIDTFLKNNPTWKP